MASYRVLETSSFQNELEEAATWLYFHNLEQSQEFADQKFQELQQEVKHLEQHLTGTPYLGQADEISGLRRFPVYGGRYFATWVIDEVALTVTMLEFMDLKYPQSLRTFQFNED